MFIKVANCTRQFARVPSSYSLILLVFIHCDGCIENQYNIISLGVPPHLKLLDLFNALSVVDREVCLKSCAGTPLAHIMDGWISVCHHVQLVSVVQPCVPSAHLDARVVTD